VQDPQAPPLPHLKVPSEAAALIDEQITILTSAAGAVSRNNALDALLDLRIGIVATAIADVPVALVLRAAHGTNGQVVPTRHQRLGREGVRLIVRARGNQIGITDLRPHDLRRTLAGTPSKTFASSSGTTTLPPRRPISPTSRCASTMRSFTIG
jgi:hypothetical protein